MSDDQDFPSQPSVPDSEPRFRLQANTWEELLEQLREIAPQMGDLQFLTPKKERVRPPDSVEPPERVSHDEIRNLADSLSHRLSESVAYPDHDEEYALDQTNWQPHRRSAPGDVRRRFQMRRRRQLQSEAGYVWLFDAMLARELDDREEAVRQLEAVGDSARLERLSEHSPHRVTRKAALDALARIGAVPALESAALYIRPEVFAPKKPKTEETQEEGVRRAAPEPYDDTRDHAIDLLSQLADRGSEDAVPALKRIVRYDFSRDGGARFRAIRRLGDRLEDLESRKDWDCLSMLYRESRNLKIRRSVVERLSRHLEELEAAEEVDGLLAVSDMNESLREAAEAAVRRIESSEGQAS
jgi:hypothetical protein